MKHPQHKFLPRLGFRPTKKMLALPSGERRSRREERHTQCHPVDKLTDELKLHPCHCHSLVGPWMTEKKSRPRGYVCVSEQRRNSNGNVLSAVMQSFIYTPSSFGFLGLCRCLTAHHICLTLREAICKLKSDFIPKYFSKRGRESSHLWRVKVAWVWRLMWILNTHCTITGVGVKTMKENQSHSAGFNVLAIRTRTY